MPGGVFRICALAACAVLHAAAALAAPRLPASDDEIVETLPASVRLWRSETADEARPADPLSAAARAERLLQAARADGDARLAGLAAGALAAWQQPDSDPLEVVLAQAQVAQFLHRFERSAALLEAVLARDPQQPQAWLTLATVRRVQGRLDASDRACASLARHGAPDHARACRLENLALRGELGVAADGLMQLYREPRAAHLRAWLAGTLGGVAELAGDPLAAERHYRVALLLGGERYVRLALADLLLAGDRAGEAVALLADEPAADAVLLRRALAAKRLNDPRAGALQEALAERLAAEQQRGDAESTHWRELALFELWLRDDPAAALEASLRNLEHQREPVDWRLHARIARAAGDRGELARLADLLKSMGVRDAQLDRPA